MYYISIIIPVYNTEKYIERCLRSILAQTYQQFEIIIVDDGSTDGSIEICKKYALKTSKIKIVQIKNSGQSVARNVGIKNASGDYICFVDSDDWIDCLLLEKAVSCFHSYSCDIVKFTSIITSLEQVKPESKDYDIEVYNASGALQEYFFGDEKKLRVQVWSGIYKKSLFHNLEFPRGKVFEDSYVTPQLLAKAQKIVYVGYPGYFYFMRAESTMHIGVTESKIAAYDVYKVLYENICKKFPEYEDYLCEKCVYQYIYTYTSLLTAEGKRCPNSIKWKKRIYTELSKDQKFFLSKKLSPSCRKQLKLFLLSPRIFNIYINIVNMKLKRK